MKELIERRREGSKSFSLDNGRTRLTAYPGPIHYKDHYDDEKEQWKDIDLTWEDNKITRAPYILVHNGNAITVTNKRTGAVHTLEILDKPNLSWQRTQSRAQARLEGEIVEIIPGRAFVRFRRSLKTADRPLESRFRVEGDPKKIRCLASHASGTLAVDSSIKDGILTEVIRLPKNPLKLPIRFDPTIDEYAIQASTDDLFWTDFPDSEYYRDFLHVGAGHGASEPPGYIPDYMAYCGCGLRFIDIDIEPNSIIHSAYLTFRASASRSSMVRTDILIEKDPDPATYPDNLGDFMVRRDNVPLSGPLTEWDFDTPWVKGVDYDSIDIAWQIQYLIEDPGWLALNAISLFWDDKRHRTNPIFIHRLAYSWDAANP